MEQNYTEKQLATAMNTTSIATQPEPEPTKIEIMNRLTELIPDDARAVDNELSSEVKGYIDQGLLSKTSGMAHITNKFNGEVFSYIFIDEKGNRTVRFLQKYDDGSCSAEFSISQNDLLTVTMANYLMDKQLKKEADSCLRRIRRDYNNKCDGRQALNVPEVLFALAEVLGKLPKIHEKPELSRAELYSMVISALKKWAQSGYYISRRGGYFQLCDGDIEQVSAEIGIPKAKLLAMLKQNDLLYLTSSCQGYQAKVPAYIGKDGKKVYQWGYCLLDPEYYARRLDPQKSSTADELNPPLEGEIDF